MTASNWLGFHFSNKLVLHTSIGNGVIPQMKLESYQPVPGVLAFKSHKEKRNGKGFGIKAERPEIMTSVAWTQRRPIPIEAERSFFPLNRLLIHSPVPTPPQPHTTQIIPQPGFSISVKSVNSLSVTRLLYTN